MPGERRVKIQPFETVMLSGRPEAWSRKACKRNTPYCEGTGLPAEACEAIVDVCDLLRMLS
jgi:hypothetical protein